MDWFKKRKSGRKIEVFEENGQIVGMVIPENMTVTVIRDEHETKGDNQVSGTTVTQEHIDSIIAESNIETKTTLGKCTVVVCQLPNGFIIVESSSCVDPANYDEKLGKEICLDRIKNKVWELEGYLLQSQTDFYCR